MEICFICGHNLRKVSGYIYRCTNCKSLIREDHQERYDKVKEIYDRDYFHQKFRDKYNQDIDSARKEMRKIAISRMEIIENLYLREAECSSCGVDDCKGCYVRNLVSSLRSRKLLDIGCGIGVFLEVGSERGFDVKGIDINRDILHLVSSEIRDKITISDFLSFEFKEKFDIVTMWFVIEHLPDTKNILRKVSSLLKPKGILAISTPNAEGLSARLKMDWYLSVLPQDHLVEFSPKGLSILLENRGFSVRKIVYRGIHPERITSVRFLMPMISFVQSKLGGGDTFEIYAVKEKTI